MPSPTFLQAMSVSDCILLLEAFACLPADLCPLDEVAGRFLAEDIFAPEDLPRTARSCMDGYAVHSVDTFGASESNAVLLECVAQIAVDGTADIPLEAGQCVAVFTGSSLPPGADAVVMQEYCHTYSHADGSSVAMYKMASPHTHVIYAGDDARGGTLVLEKGVRLDAPEIGLLAALGICAVPVHRQPRVAILSTGNEIVPVDVCPAAGQIRDVNSHTLGVHIHRAGALPIFCGIVPDDTELLACALENAAMQADCIFLSGGSSLGAHDYTLKALEQIGAQQDCHGLAMRPGKPLILAHRPVLNQNNGMQNSYFWGIPGQVASAHTCMQILGAPFLQHLAGNPHAFDFSSWPQCRALAAQNIESVHGREDYVRVRLQKEAAHTVAYPEHAPSGLLRSLLHTQGLLRIPASSEGVYAGSEVQILLI